MAGYSGTPLVKKLGIKPGAKVLFLGAPEGYAAALDLPEGVALAKQARGPLDLVQLFVTRRGELEKRLPALREALARDGSLWVSWPKGKEKARVPTDLDEHQVRELGLVDVKVCAVDETWSGLKFVYRLKDR